MTTGNEERERKRDEHERRQDAREEQMIEALGVIARSPEMSEAVLEVWAPEERQAQHQTASDADSLAGTASR